MCQRAQCKELQQQKPAQGQYPWNWVRPHRASSAVMDVGSSGTCNVHVLREGKGSSLPNLGARGASGTGVTNPFRILINCEVSTNFARCQTVARNGDKFADALRESEGRGQVSMRQAEGTVVNASGVRMDLAVKFEDLDSTESFLVLDMDKYDLIVDMPWLEKHDPWIDWCGKAIGVSRSAVSDRALVSNVPTSVQDWGAREGHQAANASEEVLRVAATNEGVRMVLATGSLPSVWDCYDGKSQSSRRMASTVAVPDGTDQAGNIGPHAAEAAEESAEGVSCVSNIGPQAGNVVPQAGNIGPQAAEAAKEDAEGTSDVGNIVPRRVEETEKNESAACVSS
ncbi:Gag protein, partial [Phytophthora palmivora]